MYTATAASPAANYSSSRPALVFITALLAAGLVYAGHELFLDLSSIGLGAELPYVLLGIALLPFGTSPCGPHRGRVIISATICLISKPYDQDPD